MARITLERLKTIAGQKFLKKRENMSVRIYSGEHGAYWGANKCGYMIHPSEAGVYTLMDAYNASSHCDERKQISYEIVRLKFPQINPYFSDKDILNAGWITHELKPCPFCGCKTIHTSGSRNPDNGYIGYTAHCGNWHCGASIHICCGGESRAEESRNEVVKMWNNRV